MIYVLWHHRMGHVSKNSLRHLLENTSGPESFKIPEKEPICPGCAKGKMTQKSFTPSLSRATRAFELLHIDLVTMPVLSYHKYKYVLTILDDYSSYAFTKNLASKSDAAKALEGFIPFVDMQLDAKIRHIRSDRGGEFMSGKFQTYLQEQGIVHEATVPHLHQQNGRAERINRTLTEKAECLRLQAYCPMMWWQFAFDTATYI